MATYQAKNWDAVLEKWCATQEQDHATYPAGHPVLEAIDDLMLTIGDPLRYSAAMSTYLKAVYAAKGGHKPAGA